MVHVAQALPRPILGPSLRQFHPPSGHHPIQHGARYSAPPGSLLTLCKGAIRDAGGRARFVPCLLWRGSGWHWNGLRAGDARQGPSQFTSQGLTVRPRTPSTRTGTRATAVQAGSGSAARWWQGYPELWEEVPDEASFKRVIEGQNDGRIVFVDFFATWCHSCERLYPELCKLAADPSLAKHIRFIKVCTDSNKSLVKSAGVKALPYVALYNGTQGKLCGFQAVPSRVKQLKTNLQTVIKNRGKSFAVDPNGFVMVSKNAAAAAAAPAAAASYAADVEALGEGKSDLFERLMSMAMGSTQSTAQAPGPVAPPRPLPSYMQAGPPRKPLLEPEVTPDDERRAAEKAAFVAQYGKDYGYEGRIDEMFQSEIGCRLGLNEHYMDYTGSSLYCNSQLEAAFSELKHHVFGNPHSANPSSLLTEDKMEAVRDTVLKWFNADPAEYQVVFTRSATGSLQLVGECFPWTPKSEFRYLRENHNSVLGIRQYALQYGGCYHSVDEAFTEDWLHHPSSPHDLPACYSGSCLTPVLKPPPSGYGTGARSSNGVVQHSNVEGSPEGEEVVREGNGATEVAEEEEAVYSLFAFPAEDNFAGVKYPLQWVKAVQQRSKEGHQWKVLIDAAAYAPTQQLDLSQYPADYVAISFYKMFGYPTGLGALLVRVDAADILRKVFWGGGTVSIATSGDDFHVLKCKPTERLEDGTVAFLDIIALRHGFEMLERLGGTKRITAHVTSLTEWLYCRLATLRHSNGSPLLKIFGKHSAPLWRRVQGAILNFEVLQPDGNPYSYRAFQRESAAAGFHIRTGSECNPGACYSYVGIEESEVEKLAGEKEGCDDDVEWISVERPAEAPSSVRSEQVLAKLQNTKVKLGHPSEIAMKWVRKPLGTVRVSLGYMSTFEDAHALATFIERTYKDRFMEPGL